VRAQPGLAVLLLCLAAPLLTPAAARAGDDDVFDEPERGDEPGRLSLTLLGGELQAISGSGRSSAATFGGEVAWRFDAIEVGVLGEAARLRTRTAEWSPVVLLRLTERFMSRRGLEASFSFGFGAAREERWKAWFQVALGMRLDLGPIFLTGEVGFEQADFIRLAGGLGTRF